MRHVYWFHAKVLRLLVILLAVVFNIILIIADVYFTFFHPVSKVNSSLSLYFGFSVFTALIFLITGSLVWLYASNRQVALLLFGFSCAMMTTIVVEVGTTSNLLLAWLGGASSTLAIPLLVALLLLFPKNYLSSHSHINTGSNREGQSKRFFSFVLLLRSYLISLMSLNILSILCSLFYYFPIRYSSDWLDTLTSIDYVVGLMSIVIIVIISYFRSSSLRERQQIRVFVGGTILAFAPFLLLTVIPQALGGSQLYGVDPQFTTLPFVLFPLALGYSVLRYQILVFDVHIRRGVAIATGIIGLVLLTYLSVTLGSIIFGSQTSLYVVCVAGVTVVLAPMVWRLGKTITERLFFSEIAYYQRLLETPTGLNEVTLDLAEAAQLIMIASSQAFDTHETCLFVVDEDTGYFRTCPNLKYDGNDVHRHTLLRRLLLPLDAEAFEDGASIVKMPRRAVQQIARAKRPLLLHEITKDGEEPPTGLARFLNTAEPADTANTMVVPVRTQGKMIAILVVGVRGDRQQYGGPDFEIAQIILSRFSPVLETARLYARANRHGALLNNLYRVSAISGNAFQTMEEVAAAYTHVATEAVATHAEIWLHDRQYQTLWHIAPDGRRSHIARDECLYITNGRDWSPWFYEGNTILEWQDNSTQVPSCLRQTPPFPFAWLPLNKGEEHMGVLVLVYPRPHTFLKEEIRVLQMFASQCAAALENTRITIELRAANERQKELDRLKDQFIVTASHELRTPLTAVQGYIELLKEYDHTLPIDMRAEFIAKAGRGCEELTLMVENIMDASRVRVDAENVRLSEFSLQPSFEYVLGILEALMKREGRAVTLAIVPELQVVADEKRLRQVMLNLLSNALKYSPAGTAIEISAEQADNQVVVRIRDYGAGITSEEQQRLFERFMRLERDINSPTRGAGLGLYICKQLVEAMRGQIWIESSGVMGEGSVFAFTLPTTLPLSYEKKRYRQTQPVEDGDKVRTR